MTRDQAITMLGAIGEGLVQRYFESQGCTVTISEDRFDDKKDMIVDGQTVEVKTLVPIYKYDAFCLPIKQSRKCEEVDRLIFIEIPNLPESNVVFYESVKDENGRRYDFREHFNNEYCQFYRLTNLVKLDTIQDRNASTSMWNLSPSIYKGRKHELTA